MSKSKSTLSWGVLFLIVGVLILFIFTLTQRVSFEKQEPLISVEGFVFNGNAIVEYNGDKENSRNSKLIFFW